MDKKLQKRLLRVAKALEIIEKRNKSVKIERFVASEHRMLTSSVDKLETALLNNKPLVPAIKSVISISKKLSKVDNIKQASAKITAFDNDLAYAKALVRVSIAELRNRK